MTVLPSCPVSPCHLGTPSLPRPRLAWPGPAPSPLPMTRSLWVTTRSWGISTSLTSARSAESRSPSWTDFVRSSGTRDPSPLSEKGLSVDPSGGLRTTRGRSCCGGESLSDLRSRGRGLSFKRLCLTAAVSATGARLERGQRRGSGDLVQGRRVVRVWRKDCGKKAPVDSLSKLLEAGLYPEGVGRPRGLGRRGYRDLEAPLLGDGGPARMGVESSPSCFLRR